MYLKWTIVLKVRYILFYCHPLSNRMYPGYILHEDRAAGFPCLQIAVLWGLNALYGYLAVHPHSHPAVPRSPWWDQQLAIGSDDGLASCTCQEGTWLMALGLVFENAFFNRENELKWARSMVRSKPTQSYVWYLPYCNISTKVSSQQCVSFNTYDLS